MENEVASVLRVCTGCTCEGCVREANMHMHMHRNIHTRDLLKRRTHLRPVLDQCIDRAANGFRLQSWEHDIQLNNSETCCKGLCQCTILKTGYANSDNPCSNITCMIEGS